MTTTLIIEQNVPIPGRKGRERNWDLLNDIVEAFQELQINDSFLLPVYICPKSSVYRYTEYALNSAQVAWDFTITPRTEYDSKKQYLGTRIWRLQ